MDKAKQNSEIICRCGKPIEELEMAMIGWNEDFSRVEFFHKGPCDDRNGLPLTWELKEFISPEGFSRFVNNCLRDPLGVNRDAKHPLLVALNAVWPSVLRSLTLDEKENFKFKDESGEWF